MTRIDRFAIVADAVRVRESHQRVRNRLALHALLVEKEVHLGATPTVAASIPAVTVLSRQHLVFVAFGNLC